MDIQALPPNNYSLYDFFDFTKPAHVFQTINGAKYPPSCFHNPTATGASGRATRKTRTTMPTKAIKMTQAAGCWRKPAPASLSHATVGKAL
jgi:hypothetical protein